MDEYESTDSSDEGLFSVGKSKRHRRDSDSDSDIEILSAWPFTSNDGRKSSYAVPESSSIPRARPKPKRPDVLPEQSSSYSSPSIVNRQSQTSRWKPTKSRRNTHVPTAYELKKLELEAAKQAERNRERIISILSDQIISNLVCMGNLSRDVAQICAEKLGWNFREWKNVLKGSQVAIYEPIKAQDELSGRKRTCSSLKRSLSLGPKPWPLSLEVDALSLCIVKSEGQRVCLPNQFCGKRQPDSKSNKSPCWNIVNHFSELSCLFVHRSVLNKFFSEEDPSVVELTRMKPRLQIFVFGTGQESGSTMPDILSSKVELILCAGAILVPTFNSLFKNYPDQDQDGKYYFERLKEICTFHPFLKVCLHPSLQVQLTSKKQNTDEINVEFIIEFLITPFDNPKEVQVNSFRDWIQLDRNSICWLCSDLDQLDVDGDLDDEVSEFHSIVKTMKEIKNQLYKEYRKFIIVLPDDHPYSNRNSWKGIELMKISTLSKSLGDLNLV